MTVRINKPAINLREELADLRKPTGIAGEAMLRAETPQEQFNLIGAGRRNIFINGGFTVSQRGDFTSATATTAQTYRLDRWSNYLNGCTMTVQQTDVVINGVSKKAAKYAATSSAVGYFGPTQAVELANFPVGATVTMSGYVRTNNPHVYFRHDYVQNVTGIQAPDPVTPDGNWHYVTWTLETSGTLQAPIFQVLAYDYGNVSVTSGDYIEIADMQLEVGKVATPFEHRSYGEELALCQRYYYQIGDGTAFGSAESGSGANAYLWAYTFRHPVPMRATPALTLINGGSTYFVGGIGVTIGTPTGDLGTVNTSSMNIATSNKTNVAVHRLGLNGFSFTRGMGYGGTSGFIHCDAEL